MARLFAALDPGDSTRVALDAMLAELRALAPLARHVDAVKAHLTLVFLGSVDDAAVAAAGEALVTAAASHAAFNLEWGDLGSFGSPTRPRVLYLGVARGRELLVALQHDVAAALAPFVAQETDRPYAPHLTLARSRHPRGDPALGRVLSHAVAGAGDAARAPLFRPPPTEVRGVTLYESVEGPGGSRYLARAEAELATSRISRP